jgi:hypothetical protein
MAEVISQGTVVLTLPQGMRGSGRLFPPAKLEKGIRRKEGFALPPVKSRQADRLAMEAWLAAPVSPAPWLVVRRLPASPRCRQTQQ